jgi:hypothetical protein
MELIKFFIIFAFGKILRTKIAKKSYSRLQQRVHFSRKMGGEYNLGNIIAARLACR